MRKFLLVMTLFFVVATLFAILPVGAAPNEVGPWVADFSEMTEESGKQIEKNQCYLNMMNSGDAWTYDETNDLVNTSGREAHLYVGKEYAQDYTIGFKISVGGNRGYFRMKLSGCIDPSTESTSQEIVKPESFSFNDACNDVSPAGSRYQLFSPQLNCIDFNNSIETGNGQQLTTITKKFAAKAWSDVRIEIDYSDDADSDVLFTAKTYLNNEYVSCIEVPKFVVASYNGKYYWTKVISPSSFQIIANADKKTQIKNMYMYNGVENKSIIPETISDSFALDNNAVLVNQDFSSATSNGTAWSNGKLSIDTAGATLSFEDGYATISNTSENTVTGSPVIKVGTAQDVSGHFIWSAKIKCDDFYAERYLFYPHAGNWLTNMLRIEKAVNTDGEVIVSSKDTAKLNLYNYNPTTKAVEAVDFCEISAEKWYEVRIVGTRDLSNNSISYKVVVKDVVSGAYLMSKSITDIRPNATSNSVRWQMTAGSNKDLNSLPAGEVSSFSIDDVYFAKGLYNCKIADVKLTQGTNLLTDTYTCEEDVKVNVLITNNTQTIKEVTLYVAEYSGENELLQIIPLTKTIGVAASVQDNLPRANSDVLSAKLTPSTNSSIIQCFIWDGIGNMKPMSKQISVTSK